MRLTWAGHVRAWSAAVRRSISWVALSQAGPVRLRVVLDDV
ncbi:hypothetical protein [Conexibacter sp. W3-3-2]|nr:hypothetical protein [Conexibacter sp. W3-3-2]